MMRAVEEGAPKLAHCEAAAEVKGATARSAETAEVTKTRVKAARALGAEAFEARRHGRRR
jgi:hypothetical protein